ncbi:MAG: carbohydrate kinase [Planctomycetales bacterium]|nr:carbohydrate kinase [Planctomycetales bacterium]
MPKVIGVGELLWDLLPEGKKLGGAPANFSYHAHALGADSHILSAVGSDELGSRAIAQLQSLGLNVDLIQIHQSLPTGTVSVALDRQGSPSFVIHEGVAWDEVALTPASRLAVSGADIVCFGSLAQRCQVSRNTIAQLLDATSRETLRIFDVNLRQEFYTPTVLKNSLCACNVLKLNDQELPILAGLIGITGTEESQMQQLVEEYELALGVLTLGSRGSLVVTPEKVSRKPAKQIEIADTVGAGDAFTAALAISFWARKPLESCHELASELAAYVCTQVGAMPGIPEKLTNLMLPQR